MHVSVELRKRSSSQKNRFSVLPLYMTQYGTEKISLSPFDLPEALSRKHKKHASRKNKRFLGKSIDERPEEAMMRIVCGHWEIDTVVGKCSVKESVVLTLVEKVTDFYLAIKIPGKG